MSREHVIAAVIAAFAGGEVTGMAVILRLRPRLPHVPLPRRKHPVPAPLATVTRLALVRQEPERPQRAAGVRS